MDGRRFGPYVIAELLGRGGMGEVYRAYDTVHDRDVALKLLPAHLAADPEFRTRFARESRIAARLGEPHVVPIHAYGELDGTLYIDMRLIDGRDLAAILARDGA
ncbi:MAG: protein kinase, partial [Pseudonocardia sp.]